jgi:hypothetical protein
MEPANDSAGELVNCPTAESTWAETESVTVKTIAVSKMRYERRFTNPSETLTALKTMNETKIFQAHKILNFMCKTGVLQATELENRFNKCLRHHL